MQNPHSESLFSLVVTPKPRIPVLMNASANKRDGRVHVLFSPILMTEGSIFAGRDVRLIDARALDLFVKEREGIVFEQEYGSMHSTWRNKLLFFFRLFAAVRIGGDKLRETIEFGINANYVRPTAADDPITELGEQLNIGIKGIIFVVWWSYQKKRFAPGLYCPDSRTALYALALSSMGEPGSLGACLRCGKAFIMTKVIKRYCSESCRQASAMVMCPRSLFQSLCKFSVDV